MSLTKLDQKILVSVAKEALEKTVVTGSYTKKDAESNSLSAHLGVFVSLYKNDNLRGCIGRITCDDPVIETVQDMAVSAGMNDSRFSPVTRDELPKLTYELTLLSPLRRLKNLNEIELGKHGLYLQKGMNSSVFLPQVPLSQGWDLPIYLKELSIKANLHPDGWKKSSLFSFEGIIFSSNDFKN
jgi:AmmeMemoRadiSam system protein A